jgi:hypothetical protein
MGFLSKLFKKSEPSQPVAVKQPLNVDSARQQEKDALMAAIKSPDLAANAEVECLAQILINETDFLVESGRLKQ